MRDCHFEDVSDDRSPLLVKFESEFSTRDDYFATGRLGWLEAFDNEKLYALILTFSERDKELLALIIEGYSRSEIADMRGVSVQAINKKINKIKKLMEGVVF
jgi:DNA-binding CsgD family transcriptional regulator